jgi:hypothetical protein
MPQQNGAKYHDYTNRTHYALPREQWTAKASGSCFRAWAHGLAANMVLFTRTGFLAELVIGTWERLDSQLSGGCILVGILWRRHGVP